jgi:enamine deaminase RidA (YjgF/YER057c/UK114 family)
MTKTGQTTKRLITSGSKWEPLLGYSRAVVAGNTVYVSGTCGVEADGSVAPDMYGQAKRALEIIKAALAQAGAEMKDVVRTRILSASSSTTSPRPGESSARSAGHHHREGLKLVDAAFMVESSRGRPLITNRPSQRHRTAGGPGQNLACLKCPHCVNRFEYSQKKAPVKGPGGDLPICEIRCWRIRCRRPSCSPSAFILFLLILFLLISFFCRSFCCSDFCSILFWSAFLTHLSALLFCLSR